ncbi:MAG: hypothetical protein GY936_20025 [Ignavibacteriae bacterium]|nr:hypothetical protein [Ignavibacteriota bacterium]
MKVVQTAEGIQVVHMDYTYTCTISGRTIKGKAERKNTWFGKNAECFQKIMADSDLRENFKKSISITFSDRKIEGSVTTPRFICNDESTPEMADDITKTLRIAKKPNNIYWITETKIMKANIDDPSTKEVVFAGLERASDIALDEGGKTIFWTENAYVYAANTDGTNKMLISKAEEPIFSPKNVIVDGYEKIVFWVEDRSIYRYDYTSGNSNRHQIIRQPVYPIGKLALDRKNKHIYWLSEGRDMNTIHQANYDGTGVEPFIEDKASSFTIDEEAGIMYCAHWESIRKIDLNTKEVEVKIKRKSEDSEIDDPLDLTYDKDFERLYFIDGYKIKRIGTKVFTVVSTKLGRINNHIFGFAMVTGHGSDVTLDRDVTFDIWTLIEDAP